MEIIHYFASCRQEELQACIAAADWSAARFLVSLLKEDRFFTMLGGEGELLILMDGKDLVSFCTVTRQDSIRDESLYPWIGFVYTAPEHRGHRYAGILLRHGEEMAARQGHRRIYIATDHVGLYEKYGYTYLENRIDYWGKDQQILYKDLSAEGATS